MGLLPHWERRDSVKRIFAVILALITVFSLSGCGFGFLERALEETEETQETVVSDEEKAEYIKNIAGPKTLAFFEEYNEKDGYYMSSTANAAGTELTLTSAVKDGKSYVNVEQAGGSYSIIIKDDKIYMLEAETKRAYAVSSASIGFGSYMEEAEDMIYGSQYSEGEVTIDGVKYQYEGYTSERGEVRYCFLGKNFRYLTVDNGSEYVAIKVNELSKNVDESLFEIPEDYKIR